MPRIIGRPRPSSMALRISRITGPRPENNASPIRKCPMLNSTNSGTAARRRAVSKSRPWPACTSSPADLASLAPRCNWAKPFASPARSSVVTASHQAPVCSSTTGTRKRAAASIAASPGSMKSETRMPCSAELPDIGNEMVVPADHIEAAFGRPLRAFLRHEADRVRLRSKRDLEHLRRRRHLEIQGLRDFRLETGHVCVADMAPIFAQMRGDAIGACLNGGERRAHRVRSRAAPCVAQGRHMVDVDAEPDAGRRR